MAKKVEKNKGLIIGLIVVSLLFIVIIGFLFYDKKYGANNKVTTTTTKVVVPKNISCKYNDGYEPGNAYDININQDTQVLLIKITSFCSALDCETKYYDYEITLTNDELSKINNFFNKYKECQDFSVNEGIGDILEALARDNEVFETIENIEKLQAEGYHYNDNLIARDINNDGQITYREFGNGWLNDVLNQ